MNPEVISTFSELWSVLDPGSGSISMPQLLWLLQRLPGPLGGPTLAAAKAKMRNMVLMRDEGGRVPFRTTLYEIMRAAIAVPLPQHVRVVQQHMDKMHQFFERSPVDSNGMIRALRGTFDLDYLLIDDDDMLWPTCGSVDDDGQQQGISYGGGDSCAGGKEGNLQSDGPQAQQCLELGGNGGRGTGCTDVWRRGGLAGLFAQVWGYVKGTRRGRRVQPVRDDGADRLEASTAQAGSPFASGR